MITHATVLAAPPAENTARRLVIHPVPDARQRVRTIVPEAAKTGVEETAPAFFCGIDIRGEKMETTVHYAINADSSTEASYLRNLPLIKLLQQEPVDVEDWGVLLSAAPNGEDKLFWCLGYIGALCALDATDFDSWFIYCLTVVESALNACEIKSVPDERKNLLALGLAARTFNFSANPVTKQMKCGDTLRSVSEYSCSEDADIFAMWYVLRTLTEYLRLDFNNNLRALTSALGAMNKIRARYTQIAERLPKMDAC